MNPIYKFELSADGTTFHRVYPLYKADLEKEYNKEQNQQFFRASLSGKLTFVGPDYAFIKEAAFETQFELTLYISYDAGATWSLYWTGRFWKIDCEINEDDRTIVVQPEVYDEYNDVLAGMEKEYDLIKLAPEIQHIRLDKRPMAQVYVPGDTVVGCFLSGMYWEQDCEAFEDESALVYTHHFKLNSSIRIVAVSGASEDAANGAYNGEFGQHQDVDYPYEFSSRGFIFKYYVTGLGSHSEPWVGHHELIRISDGLKMWQRNSSTIPSPTGVGTITLTPVEGTGAIGNVTAIITDKHIFGRYVCDTPTIGGQNTYQLLPDDPVIDHRNYNRCVGWDFIIAIWSGLSNTPTEYGIYQPGQYYTSPPPAAQIPQWFPVARYAWDIVSVWFGFRPDEHTTEVSARKEYVLKNVYTLGSAISKILDKIAPGITHEETTEYSQFLYGINPISGNDYRLYISPKSNILAGQYDQPAQKAPITLKMLTDMLRDCFKCYWFIEDGKFKIEHLQYFRNGGSYDYELSVGLDLTQQVVPRNNKAWSFNTSIYSYNKDRAPERYQFGWMDEVTRYFEGYPIDVISKYVQQGKIEEIKSSDFTSDVDYMLLNPGACSEDGFALLAGVPDENGVKIPYLRLNNNVFLQNGYLAFYDLQQYYMYDMPTNNIRINGIQPTVRGLLKLKTQNIKFPAYQDPDPIKLIQTELGSGEIEKLSINLSSRSSNATLNYDAE